MEVKRLILSDSISRKVSWGKGNTKKFLTIHQTGNSSRGANAMAHHNLQARNGVGYGWHWQVDDKEAIQSHSHDYKIWHAGDGYGSGNCESIGIEICINEDGNYKKAVENGARLSALILKEENIPISKMVQHNHWTGKNCPKEIRACKDGICWSGFVAMVKKFLNENKEEKVVNDPREKISKRYMIKGSYSIDSLPWYCSDKKNVGTTDKYVGFVVTVTRKWGSYWYSQFLGGWIDSRAFEDVDNVDFKKTVTNDGFSVDTLPWGTEGYKTVNYSGNLKGKNYRITAKKGAYLYVYELAKWVDEKAFE